MTLVHDTHRVCIILIEISPTLRYTAEETGTHAFMMPHVKQETKCLNHDLIKRCPLYDQQITLGDNEALFRKEIYFIHQPIIYTSLPALSGDGG